MIRMITVCRNKKGPKMIEEQMMRPVFGTMFQVVKTPEEVLPAILNMPEWDRNARKNAKI